MLPRKSFFYRFIALTLAFAIFGVAIFVPILSGSKGDNLPGIIALSVYAGVYLVTLIINEIIVFRKKRKAKKEENQEEDEENHGTGSGD